MTTVDKESLQYQRFIRHVQFLIRRLRRKEYIHAQDDFVSMIKITIRFAITQHINFNYDTKTI